MVELVKERKNKVVEMGIQGDRKNYVMSVELAMQREMVYRLKLDKQSLAPLSQTSARPCPSISSQESRTPPFYGPIHGPQNLGSVARPPPYPYPSPLSRPSPSTGSSFSVVPKQKGRVPLPDGVFTCKVCHIDCKTGFNLLNHYQGHKHKSKLREMKGKEVAGVAVVPMPKANERERQPYCDVCGIWCSDEFSFRLHFSCTNHILRQYDHMMKTRVSL